jgi:dTDP-glucose 4,6-dehydratase
LDLAIALTPGFWSRFGGARLFITGGTGFIGSWLVQTIQRANDRGLSHIKLVVLTRNAERSQQQAPHMFARADTTLVAGDVVDFSAQLGALDLCIHAATDVGDPGKTADPRKVFDAIVLGTQRVLDFATAHGVSHFLLASSGAVYGTQPPELERIAESYAGAPDPLQAAAAYGNGKRAAEWLACNCASQAGFSMTIARIFALLGPGMPLNGPFAAGNFIRDVLADKPLCIQGDGRPLRSYLYMADLVVWLLRMLESGDTGQAYNVGSEHAVSIRELAQAVTQAAQVDTRLEIAQAGDSRSLPLRYVPDTRKAQQSLHLSETTPLHEALIKTIQWNRSAMTA